MEKDKCFKQIPQAGRKIYEVPDDVVKLLKESKHLSSENYEVLLLELIKARYLPKEQIVKMKNLLISEERRARKDQGDPSASKDRSGQSRMIDPGLSSSQGESSGADAARDRSGQPSMFDPGLSSITLELPAPVTKIPLIVRTDIAAASEILTLDTEKVTDINHKPVSGDVAVVGLKGRLVFWAHIFRDIKYVCRLNTAQTGLTKAKLELGVPLEMVQSLLELVLKGKTVAGFKIGDDFESLGFTRDVLYTTATTVCELQSFFRDECGNPIKLSQLAIHFTGNNPQEGAHSSLRDARITAICYRKMIALKAMGMSVFRCDNFDKFRREAKKMPKPKEIWEPCRCGRTKTASVMEKKQMKINAKLSEINYSNLSEWD